MSTLEAHEIATIFPAMSEVDLEHLRTSIEKQGQLEEILVFEGKILDGRHRYEACLALGIEPKLRTFEGTQLEAFSHSVARNLSRRHLTVVQRAAAGAGIKEFQTKILSAAKPKVEAAPAVEEQPKVEAPAPEIDVSIDETPPAPKPARTPSRHPPSAKKINAQARQLASDRVGVSGRAIDQAEKIKQQAPDVFERMLKGQAGTMPDVKRVTALPPETREKVHALVDSGKQLRAALKEVAPAPEREEGAVFLGKVVLEPEQAKAFESLCETLGIKRAEAAREAVLDWIAKQQAVVEARRTELVGAS
jgi:ParB-like chromosome segregation protein Spo0J